MRSGVDPAEDLNFSLSSNFPSVEALSGLHDPPFAFLHLLCRNTSTDRHGSARMSISLAGPEVHPVEHDQASTHSPLDLLSTSRPCVPAWSPLKLRLLSCSLSTNIGVRAFDEMKQLRAEREAATLRKSIIVASDPTASLALVVQDQSTLLRSAERSQGHCASLRKRQKRGLELRKTNVLSQRDFRILSPSDFLIPRAIAPRSYYDFADCTVDERDFSKSQHVI